MEVMLEFVAIFTVHNVLGELAVDTCEPENGTPNERMVGAIKRLLEQTGWTVRHETSAASSFRLQEQR